jgi:hypothetical protein
MDVMKKSEELRALAAKYTTLAEQYENLERSELQIAGHPAPAVRAVPIPANPAPVAHPKKAPVKRPAKTIPPRKIAKEAIQDSIRVVLPSGPDTAEPAALIASRIGEHPHWVGAALSEMVKEGLCHRVGNRRSAAYYR